MDKKTDVRQKLMHRVIALFNREQLDFLDKLSKDALFTTGRKLPRTKILLAMIDVLQTLNIDAKDIKTAQEFKERILEALKQQPVGRRFIRLDMSVDIDYRALESLKDHIKSYTKNVSEKGIMISLSKRLEPNTLLEIAIKFPGDERPICGIGKIVWIKKNPRGSDFDAGIDITYVRNEDKERFVKYLTNKEAIK